MPGLTASGPVGDGGDVQKILVVLIDARVLDC